MKNLLIAFLLLNANAFGQARPDVLNIIPQPANIKMGMGYFSISKKTVLVAADEGDKKTAEYFNTYLKQVYGITLDIDKQEGKNYIRLITKKHIQAAEKDAYTFTVAQQGITIEGDTYAGTFHGLQTLIQLLPANFQQANTNAKKSFSFSIPVVTITDQPRFNYRGMHLDVARHFFPATFVKRYIEFLALHKLNYFHWHLTDDQGWRIEIKKYPELLSTAAYRNGTIIGRYPGTGNDNIRYGGYYTQDEVKEVVAYAAARHITVVPEIEMPGHASAAIAAYPWLSCFPEKSTTLPGHPSEISKQTTGKKVQETWGVFEDIFCAGKDSTFVFLQNVLDEVLPLFPSPYIHLGGDEAPKSHWKKCPSCQARIKTEELKDEHELQSYFVQRMEKYLNSKGRTLIGWDEILEGGLAPNAVVMSWRGEKGGITAARENHKVIMTPEKPMYLDHTQSRNEDSVTIGGFNPLENVYNYDPLPKELAPSFHKYIMGAQANLWSEYLKNTAKIEYMLFPRLAALSEVLWTAKETKNWAQFEKKLPAQLKRYDLWKINYSNAYYNLQGYIKKTASKLSWVVKPKQKKTIIKITDPSQKVVYLTGDSINYSLAKNGVYKAQQVTKKPATKKQNDVTVGSSISIRYVANKATGKEVQIKTSPNPKYPGGGAFSLVNGIYSDRGLSYPDWLGWVGDDMEATIDLGKITAIDSVRMHTLNQNGSWIYLPQYVEVLVSTDGVTYSAVGRSVNFTSDYLTMGWITVPLQKIKTRYIKVVAKNYGIIPDGQPGGGNKAWLFADEVQVY